jgi:ABC-type glutathione transport system ATPase component
MIQIQDLNKTFLKDGLKIEALRGLNLQIEDGDSLAIVGHPGRGKAP